MAKKKISKEDRIEQYKGEFETWLNILSKYHTGRFDKNYKQYTAYTETVGTKTKISDPVASEQVERVIQKLFQRDPKFYAMAKGKNLPKKITNVMVSVADYFWTNPEIVQASGNRRSVLKVIGREFCVTGNAGTETFYNTKADCPDFRVIPIEDIVFDPTKTLKTSDCYYIRQFVSLDYLKKNIELTKDGKIVSGLFKNIDRLKNELADPKGQTTDKTSNQISRSGDATYDKPVDKLELISRWEGSSLCQWVKGHDFLIREVIDPIQVGDDPLDFAMDIEVPKQPYAFSFLDFINGLTTAKDLILNQVIDYGAKLLNKPIYVDPAIGAVNLNTVRNAFKIGGVVLANPAQIAEAKMEPIPAVGFQLLDYTQQRSEQVSGIGAYIGGVPNQTSDKTKGTFGGIQAMIEQASDSIRDRQLNIEESIIEPIINKWLKMSAALMGDNEIKYIFISGENSKWVQVTKGLLTGKIALGDLITAELVDTVERDENGMTEADAIANEMMMNGQNPEKTILFDVDWVLRVEAGSLAETDTQKEIESFNNWIDKSLEIGVMIDKDKVSKELGQKAGIKEPEQYILSPEEVQAQIPGEMPQDMNARGMSQAMPPHNNAI